MNKNYEFNVQIVNLLSLILRDSLVLVEGDINQKTK